MSEPMNKYLTKDNKIMFDCLSNVAIKNYCHIYIAPNCK